MSPLRLGALLAGALLLNPACGDGETIVCDGTVTTIDGKQTCVPAQEPESEPEPQGSTEPTGGGTEPGASPSAEPDSQPVPEPEFGAEPDPAEFDCPALLEGTKHIGAGCGKHCECATGYCYDQAYMEGFRFCTRACEGGCGPDNEYKCLLLDPGALTDYPQPEETICQAVCTSVEDCKKLSSDYDQCGTDAGGTKWNGKTLTIVDTCQASAYLD